MCQLHCHDAIEMIWFLLYFDLILSMITRWQAAEHCCKPLTETSSRALLRKYFTWYWEIFHLILGSVSPEFSVLLIWEWRWRRNWWQWRWRTWRWWWWQRTWRWRWWQNLPPAVLLWSICLHHRLQGTRLDFGSRPFHFDQGFVVNSVERNSNEFLFLFGSFISTKRGQHKLCEYFWIWQMDALC